MVTFQRAAGVNAGEPLTSRQVNSQAQAFNDRILSGVGDVAWRIVDYAWGLGRQIRNPAGVGEMSIGQWPYADEWLRIYAYLDPRTAGVTWPEADPGEEEGVNVANPLGAFVFGNATSGLSTEEDRISIDDGAVPLWLNFDGSGYREPRTPLEMWTLGQQQRGGIDPSSGVMSAPVISAAQSHYQLQYPAWSRFLAAYGGFLPSREPCRVDDSPAGCGDILFYDDAGTPYETPRFEVVFTPTAYGASLGRAVKRYTGFCPPNAPNASGDCNGMLTPLAGIGYGELWYTLYGWQMDGEGNPISVPIEHLSTAEYLEGPYAGGGVLGRDVRGGRHLNVAMNWFAHDFRGSREQMASATHDPAATAFAFESFLKRQYALAPARGNLKGQQLVVNYSRWTWDASAPGGTRGTLQGGGQSHAVAEHFVCAGMCAVASKLAQSVTLRLLDSETGAPMGMLTLTPDQNGDASALVWFESARRVTVTAETSGSLDLQPGGSVWLEIAELWGWKPTIADAYVALRLMSTKGGESQFLDTDGLDVDSPIRLFEQYAKSGCLVNPGAAGLTTTAYLTENPIYEAARRMIVGNVRLAARPQLLGYAVQDGKSVLWFKRYAVLSNHDFDLFAGIAPSRTPVSQDGVQSTVRYQVVGGVAIRYEGVVISAGTSFTGGEARGWEPDDSSTGEEQVFEVTAIRRQAPPRGTSNRWVMFGSFNAYRDMASSLWKPELYDNSILYHNRCQTLSPQLRGSSSLNMHFTLGQHLALISEALPGYTYTNGINGGSYSQLSPQAKADHYRSCPIYPAPYEIESAVDEPGNVVKVTLTGRIRHCPGAPASIPNTPSAWTWLNGGPAVQYRTDENALCDYLRYQAGGPDCKHTSEAYTDNPNPETDEPTGYPWQIGDMANPNEQYKLGSDKPRGACLPRLYFVKLVEEVWEDDPPNDTPDDRDTAVWMDTMAQREWYLRAMAGGFLDERSTTELSCEAGHLFDYSFENLCLAAFGGRALPVLPASLEPNPWGGHGPLPNTGFYAEVFNAVSQCVNLLTQARVMLPIEVRSQTSHATAGRTTVAPNLILHPVNGGPCNSGAETVSSGLNAAWWNSVAGVPETGWYDGCAQEPGACQPVGGWASASGMRTAGPGVEPATGIRMLCSGGHYECSIEARCTYGRVTLNAEHPALLAVPEELRSQVVAAPGFLGWWETEVTWLVRDDTGGSDLTSCGGYEATLPTAWMDGTVHAGVKYRNEVQRTRRCVLFNGGDIIPPPLPASAMWYQHPLAEVACQGGPTSQASFTPINDRDMFIAIPLRD